MQATIHNRTLTRNRKAPAGSLSTVEAAPQTTVTDEQRAALKAAINTEFQTVRSGGIVSKVWLVEVGNRKVKLKRELDAKDSFSESIEKFVRFYKPS